MNQSEHPDGYEALMQFLYRAPIGLVQTSLAGDVEMLNPMASSLLMPLTPDGSLDNLFAVLDDIAPQLRGIVAGFTPPSGVLCDGMRLPLGDVAALPGAPQVLSISLMKLDPQRLMAVITDATQDMQREQETLSRRLKSVAHTDTLTKMPNRAAVHEQLQLMMARPAKNAEFALLLLNCDRFRHLNDRLGEAACDKLLIQISERVRSALRPPSDRIETVGRGQLAARVGGDEFVVVLDGLRSLQDAESVALRLLDAIAKPYQIGGQPVVCTVSMGLVWGASAHDADETLHDADLAMVEAKRGGGNRYAVFELAMRERAVRRAGIETELRRALQEEQLFVMYQPVVGLTADGTTDRSAGVEALVRWQHPVRGMVPPMEFIQIAEECGLIGAIGDFVLARACRDFMRWRADLGARAPRLLAVNLSRAQLGQANWTAAVADILQTSGMSPEQLQLEVTESLAAQDQGIQQRLHELKALGIQLALDDFGTGYSSLSSLHMLPVDTVKIDRSFVCKADTSHHHRVLIEATVKVAQSLGMNTVAEGIETEAQSAAVRQQQCAKGQGYFYSRPLTAAALADWVRADAADAVPG